VPLGRTRQFDPDETLERALGVFWARGYEGATLSELTRPMWSLDAPNDIECAAFGATASSATRT
jgi:hypothetical protein